MKKKMEIKYCYLLLVILSFLLPSAQCQNIVQANSIFYREQGQNFYISKSIFLNNSTGLYYSSADSCNSSIIKEEQNDQINCIEKPFKQTSLLQKCYLRVDTKNLCIECHGALFFITLQDLFASYQEASKVNEENNNMRIRVFDFEEKTQNMTNFSSSEEQLCLFSKTLLQCRQISQQKPTKFNVILSIQDSIQKQNDSDSLEADSFNQQEIEELEGISINSFEQLSLGEGRSIGVSVLSFPLIKPLDKRELQIIIIFTDSSKFEKIHNIRRRNFDLSEIGLQEASSIKGLGIFINEIKGKIVVQIACDIGIWVFEINLVNLKEMQFVGKLQSDVEIVKFKQNILCILSKNEMKIFRTLMYSYKIQNIAVIDISELSNSLKEFDSSSTILRIFKNSIQDLHNSNQDESTKSEEKANEQGDSYLISILFQNRTTTIFLGAFPNDESYLTPLYSILFKDKLLEFSFRLNQQDLGDFNLAEDSSLYLMNNQTENNQDIIFDFQMVTYKNRKLLLYSAKNSIFVEPICFPNEKFKVQYDKNISSLHTNYLGCSACQANTFSQSLQSEACSPFIDIDHDQAFGLLNYKDLNCSSTLKGPLCQTCEDYQNKFLIKEKNMKLVNTPSPLYINQQTICFFECQEDDQNLLNTENNFNITHSQIQTQEGECIEGPEKLLYDNFCSQFTECFECSYHPFCFFDSDQQICVKIIDQQGKLSEIPQVLIYKKYLKCEIKQPQSVCKVNAISQRTRGELAFSKNQEVVQWSFEEQGVKLDVDQDQPFELIHKYQLCSWYVDTELKPEEADYLLKIETQKGVIRGKLYLQGTLSLCYSIENLKTEQNCIRAKLDLNIGDNLMKKIRFRGGKFRITLQFEEQGLIDTSKINISYMPFQNHDGQLLIVLSILLIVLFFTGAILCLVFKNNILYCIRVRFNTLSFFHWEDNIQLTEFSSKQILRKLIKDKLVKQEKKGNQKEKDNLYDQTTCSICLAEFDHQDVLYVLICAHHFHSHCLEEWVKVQFNPVTCPVCKIPLTSSAFAMIENLRTSQINKLSLSSQDQNKEQELSQLPSIQLEGADQFDEQNEISVYEDENLLYQPNSSHEQNI